MTMTRPDSNLLGLDIADQVSSQAPTEKTEDDDFSSEDEADLPPVPQAPRHPTQGESSIEIEEEEADGEEGELEPEEPSFSYQRVWKGFPSITQGVAPVSDYDVKEKIGEGTFG